MKFVKVVFIILVWHNLALAHPFYVSVTQIDFKENTLQITLKIFSDDLEDALSKKGTAKLFIGEKNEHPETEKLIKNYLKEQFKLQINNKDAEWQWIGKETEEDATWCYLEVRNIKKIKTLEVTNTILFELFDSQTNLINTSINNKKKSVILSKRTPTEIIEFK